MPITSANPARGPAALASPVGWQGTYARGLALSDLVAVIAAVGIAQIVRFGSSSSSVSAALGHRITYTEVSIALVIGWMAALAINGARSTRVIGSGIEESPFLSMNPLTGAYLLWAAVWTMLVLGLAALSFQRRDL